MVRLYLFYVTSNMVNLYKENHHKSDNSGATCCVCIYTAIFFNDIYDKVLYYMRCASKL